ncbi:glycosyltransferase family 4 protein [Vibrio owensii]|uniref:glycosyltransferase family 4 protein n=1 Tax=Vibrio owensii TaxID=696485 RepID=UPI0028958862|nr:conserved hypothetical protein [Vibrio owensii]
MSILVLSQTYPSETSPYQMMYVHNRCSEYIKLGHSVTVLSFSAKEPYEFKGVNVVTEKYFYENLSIRDFTSVVSHAPNVRNGFRFLYKYKPKNIILFIHGHEALNYLNYYPGEYTDRKVRNKLIVKLSKIFRYIYEKIKLRVFNIFVRRFSRCLKIVFVSDWMRRHYIKNVGELPHAVSNAIIPNSCNQCFFTNSWNCGDKEYDFVSIRPLSGRKYAVDVIVDLANKYPKLKFALYGKGNAFKYINKPDNLDVFEIFVQPEQIPDILDRAKFALMPTRLDAQGVMMCEMATYGIPLITSDISVCKEVFQSFDNVFFINNENPSFDFDLTYEYGSGVREVNYSFHPKVLANRELDFIIG